MKIRCAFIVMAVLGMLAPRPGVAEQYSAEAGGSFYASSTPHLAGHVSLLYSLDDGKTFSFSSIEVRGPNEAQPVYLTRQGVARLVESGRWLDIYGTATGGVAASSDATSGLFTSGGLVAVKFSHSFQVLIGAQALSAPAVPGGWQPLLTVGIRLTP